MRLFPLPKTLRSRTDNFHFYPVLYGNYANCSIECHADKHYNVQNVPVVCKFGNFVITLIVP